MATVLLIAETFNLAETTRMIEVGTELRRRGHRCVLLGYSRRYLHLAQEAGLTVVQGSPELTDADAAALMRVDQGRGVRHPFTPPHIRTRVRDERALIRSLAVDTVVIGTALSAMISARAEGVPLVYIKPFALSRPHLEQVRSFPVALGSGHLSHLLDAATARIVRRAVDHVRIMPRAFRIVPEENGVARPTATIDLLEADLNLVTSLPQDLEDFHLPINYRAIGPVFARLPGELPEIVRTLADQPMPLVYFALGSSGSRRLALQAVRAFAKMPVSVIAPITHYLRNADHRLIPPNVHVVDLLPAHRLAGLIDASVIHGGEGTVQTACLSGAPFVGIGLQSEQVWNIETCVAHGSALRLRRAQVRTSAFAHAVRTVVEDSSLRQAAHRVQAMHAAVNGVAQAANEIETMLQEGRR